MVALLLFHFFWQVHQCHPPSPEYLTLNIFIKHYLFKFHLSKDSWKLIYGLKSKQQTTCKTAWHEGKKNEMFAMQPAGKTQVAELTVCNIAAVFYVSALQTVTGSSCRPSPMKSAEIDIKRTPPRGEKSGPKQGKGVMRRWTVALHVQVKVVSI